MLENEYLCGSDAIFEGVDLVSAGRVVFNVASDKIVVDASEVKFSAIEEIIEDVAELVVVVTTVVVDVDVLVVVVVEGGTVVVEAAYKIIQSS